MTKRQCRTVRIDLRISVVQKRRLERLSDLAGLDLSVYMIHAALGHQLPLRSDRATALSLSRSLAILDTLENRGCDVRKLRTDLSKLLFHVFGHKRATPVSRKLAKGSARVLQGLSQKLITACEQGAEPEVLQGILTRLDETLAQAII